MSAYTDSHCHLYDSRGVAVDDVIAAARAAGVTTMINVGCDAATTEQAIAVAASHDDIFATAGLHPHEAKHGVETILAFVDDPNIVAIGECGLDYFYDHSPRAEQREAFAAQIQLA
ncbi:MAG: TatD DNase family protein, partial [Ilumatobacteraceae bacterium]